VLRRDEKVLKSFESGLRAGGDRLVASGDGDGLGVRGGKLGDSNVVKDNCDEVGVLEPDKLVRQFNFFLNSKRYNAGHFVLV
jgi:hypothetical protein